MTEAMGRVIEPDRQQNRITREIFFEELGRTMLQIARAEADAPLGIGQAMKAAQIDRLFK